MEQHMYTISHILSHSPAVIVTALAEQVLQHYPADAVAMISGCVAVVQLRMQESVANSVFNAGEILVTETRLELNGTFGFGMIIGNDPTFATALAVIDAALRIPGDPHAKLHDVIAQAWDAASAPPINVSLPQPIAPKSNLMCFKEPYDNDVSAPSPFRHFARQLSGYCFIVSAWHHGKSRTNHVSPDSYHCD
jgi:alpha-D-ribose 1-methylphosphonate 5-triphosphate synthase subunit PhnG